MTRCATLIPAPVTFKRSLTSLTAYRPTMHTHPQLDLRITPATAHENHRTCRFYLPLVADFGAEFFLTTYAHHDLRHHLGTRCQLPFCPLYARRDLSPLLFLPQETSFRFFWAYGDARAYYLSLTPSDSARWRDWRRWPTSIIRGQRRIVSGGIEWFRCRFVVQSFTARPEYPAIVA